MSEETGPDTDAEMPLIDHLVELRTRLLRALLAVLVVFLGLFSFSAEIYAWLADPLLAHLPEGASMIATEVASPFLAPFKLTLVLAVFIAIPVVLSQIWAFIAPGLYKHEQRLVLPLIVSSTLLFYLGAAFAYFAVFPLVFGFFTSVAPAGVTVMTDISRYLDFVLKMFFAFGLAFEVPIATLILIRSGIVDRQQLGRWRPYVVLGAFLLGMLLTPPDVISQVLLAVPVWLLFEVGLVLSRFLPRAPETEEETDP